MEPVGPGSNDPFFVVRISIRIEIRVSIDILVESSVSSRIPVHIYGYPWLVVSDTIDILVELSVLAWVSLWISMENHGHPHWYPHLHGSSDRLTWGRPHLTTDKSTWSSSVEPAENLWYVFLNLIRNVNFLQNHAGAISIFWKLAVIWQENEWETDTIHLHRILYSWAPIDRVKPRFNQSMANLMQRSELVTRAESILS